MCGRLVCMTPTSRRRLDDAMPMHSSSLRLVPILAASLLLMGAVGANGQSTTKPLHFTAPLDAEADRHAAERLRFAARELPEAPAEATRTPDEAVRVANRAIPAERCANPNALGVSRTITIDTRARHHFGTQQYRNEEDLLRDREVVLTFDDGPLRRHTRRVLKALDDHCTKATFFVVGRMALADPDMLRKVSNAGHTIAHHSWSHLNQNRYSFPRAIAEFELGLSAVEAVIGKPTAPFFRFPYLADPRRMQQYLAQRDFGIFSIDIDSNDWRTKSASRVHSTIMRGLRRRGKGILLFHDIQTSTSSDFKRLLNSMRKEGFRIVHMVASNEAETLPEYDREAAVLLEKRSFRRRARPLKTAFRFEPPAGDPVTARERADRPSRRSSDRPRVTRSQAGPQRPQVVREPVRAVPRPAPSARQDWRTSVFRDD